MRDCPACGGEGFFLCDNCDGDSTSIGGCPVCCGEETEECEACEGTGLFEEDE